MDTKFVGDCIDEKQSKNDRLIIFSFFELRIKYDLTEVETAEFLELAKNRLTNNGYRIYYTGQSYVYDSDVKKVLANELMVAVKE